MSKSRLLLKEFEMNDFSIIKDIYNSDVRLAIKGFEQKINFTKLKRFIKKNENRFKTISFDNQRIGVVFKNKKTINILIRYGYLNKISYDKIYKSMENYIK